MFLLRKMSFLECPEAPVSEHSAAVKEFTGRKHYWNLFGRTFILDFPLIQDKLSRKTSLFVGCEILGLFGNTLATDHMYSRHNWGKFSQHVETPLSQKAKKIFTFLSHFFTLKKILHIFKRNVRFIAQIVGKLLAPKNVLAWMPESSCFRTLFRSESVHGKQTVLKSFWRDVYPNFPLIQDNLSQKRSLFVRCEILGLFGNTLAADQMYSPHNWGKLPQHVKTSLS